MTVAYVVDTSVLIQGYINDPNTKRMHELLRLATNSNVSLIVPEFALVECANVLWKRVRFHGADQENTLQRIKDVIISPLQVYSSLGLLPRALDIGLAQTLAVYDCVHIALAENLQCPLITIDERQANAATAVGVTLKSITDFPEYTEEEN